MYKLLHNYLPIKDIFYGPTIDFPIVLIHFSPLKSGQPLYSGQISWSQCVLYKEVPLYMYLHTCTYALTPCACPLMLHCCNSYHSSFLLFTIPVWYSLGNHSSVCLWLPHCSVVLVIITIRAYRPQGVI